MIKVILAVYIVVMVVVTIIAMIPFILLTWEWSLANSILKFYDDIFTKIME